MRNYKLKKNHGIFLSFFTLTLVLSGCTSLGKQWKALVSGGETSAPVTRKPAMSSTYSQQNNLMPSTYRQYKRTTRKDIEDRAHLESKAGSLWVTEGQGSYLFAQNTVRMIGDSIAVRIEGDPQEQLSSKAGVISKLLAQLEERRRRAQMRAPAGENKAEANKEASGAAAAADATAQKNPETAGAAPGTSAPAEEKKDFNVKMVPTRVVERLVDGNYRVRGTQPFLIGSREYKVIVSGVVKAEDFNDDGISAAQLLDSSFDIVSSKNTETK